MTRKGKVETDTSTGRGSAVGGLEKLVMGEVLRSGTEGSQKQTRMALPGMVHTTDEQKDAAETYSDELNVDSVGSRLSQKTEPTVCSRVNGESSRSHAEPTSDQFRLHAFPLSPRQVLITILFLHPSSPTPDRWRRIGREVITVTSV